MFKKGKKVICIKKEWKGNNPAPKYLEEVTVNETAFHPITGCVGHNFFEYGKRNYFRAKWFRSPVDISDEVKNSFPEIIEEKIDIPQLEPTL